MNRKNQRGFTLVELLVVLVLGLILLLVTYQVLATNVRVFALNTARVDGQQTLRGGVDILSGELREISTKGGDLVEMGEDSLMIRAQRSFGVVCAVDYAANPVELTTFRIGPTFQAEDSVFVLHDNDPTRASDDEWFVGEISSVDLNGTCNGDPAQILAIPMLRTNAQAFPPDSVRAGAPVRGFDIYTYGRYVVGGESFLGRRAMGESDPALLVGPIPDMGGVQFRYLDRVGQVTTVDTLVAQIEVIVKYESEMTGFTTNAVSDSVLVRVFPRN
jgi:prepilin-type N-terminal cleavage/methylation domain-containing protein